MPVTWQKADDIETSKTRSLLFRGSYWSGNCRLIQDTRPVNMEFPTKDSIILKTIKK